jgi:hypothetical protein
MLTNDGYELWIEGTYSLLEQSRLDQILRQHLDSLGIDASLIGTANGITRILFENQYDLNLFKLDADLKEASYDHRLHFYRGRVQVDRIL